MGSSTRAIHDGRARRPPRRVCGGSRRRRRRGEHRHEVGGARPTLRTHRRRARRSRLHFGGDRSRLPGLPDVERTRRCHGRRGGRHRGRAHGPGRARAGAPQRRGHRHHRVGRQDDDEGHSGYVPGVDVLDGRKRTVVQQRAWPAADVAQRTRGRAEGRARDGRPRLRPHHTIAACGPSRGRDRNKRRPGPCRVLRRPRWRGPGQG